MKESKSVRGQGASSWRKKVIYILISIVLVLIGFGGFLFYETYQAANKSYSNLERAGEKSVLRKQIVTIGDDPISILLIGVENYSTDGQDGRADTQVVITLNPNTNKMTMTSIPRDTRVKINKIQQYAGFHKINAAYTFGSISDYGGSKLTVETVEQLLDIPIDKYVALDFEGFRDIVDALGGVTIDVKQPFWEENIYNNDKRIYYNQGPAHLNGEEALAFVRMRKRAVNSIYPRDERQRQFIKATVDQAMSAETILKVGEISAILGKNIETNLKPSEIYTLERAYSSMNASEIETFHFEGKNRRINDLYYFVPDNDKLEQVSQRLKGELGLSISKTIPTIYK